MKKTMIVWRRLGKEHGENAGYRVNPDEVVCEHLESKLNIFRQTDETDWKWWQVNEDLLVETTEETNEAGDIAINYYLPRNNWLVVKNFPYGSNQGGWKWYIHIGSTRYDDTRSCWVFTDWFSDVLVKPDNVSHTVLDLDDLARGFELGLITKEELNEILISTQALVDAIRNGQFPPAELEEWRAWRNVQPEDRRTTMLFVDLETPRLSLRNIGKQDRTFVFAHFSDPEVTRCLFDAEPLTELAGADEIIDEYLHPEPRGQHRWILERKEDGVKIGTCGFHCWNLEKGSVELGYDLAAPFWRKGYMTEALRAIIGFAKQEMRVNHIHAHVYVENPASYKLVEKLGFVKTGAYAEVFRGDEYPHDIYTLAL